MANYLSGIYNDNYGMIYDKDKLFVKKKKTKTSPKLIMFKQKHLDVVLIGICAF